MITDTIASSRINTIHHPNRPEVAQKFNFFGDCMNLINRKAGEFGCFEVETHVTLVNSLVYFVSSELTNNERKHAENTVSHVQYLAKNHPLLKGNDRVVKKYYPSIVACLTNVVNATGATPFDKLAVMLTELNSVYNAISTSYIDNLVEEISRAITCQHQVVFHQKDFDYYARLVFSFFYLNKYPKKDIATFVKRLLNADAESHDDRISVDSPLPPALSKKLGEHNTSNASFNQDLLDEINSYFKNRSMKEQIAGFVNLASYEKQEFSFFYKADGFYLRDKELAIDGIRMQNTEDFIKEHDKKIFDGDRDRFLQTPSAIIQYPVWAYSQWEAVDTAMEELKMKLDRIGFVLNRRLYLDTRGYLIETDKNLGFWLNDTRERQPLTEWDVEVIDVRNKALSNPIFKTFITAKERILVTALAEENINRSLHGYSKFVDQITKGCMTGITNGQSKVGRKVIAFAYLLLMAEQKEMKKTLRRWAYNAVINSGDADQTILTVEDSRDFRTRKLLPSVSEIHKKFKHRHTRYRLKEVIGYQNSADVEAFHYYVRYILLLTKYRNVAEHIDTDEEQLARKLKVSVNEICSRVLHLVITELKKPTNSNKTPLEVVTGLIAAGQTKANALGITI